MNNELGKIAIKRKNILIAGLDSSDTISKAIYLGQLAQLDYKVTNLEAFNISLFNSYDSDTSELIL